MRLLTDRVSKLLREKSSEKVPRGNKIYEFQPILQFPSFRLKFCVSAESNGSSTWNLAKPRTNISGDFAFTTDLLFAFFSETCVFLFHAEQKNLSVAIVLNGF